MGGSYVAHFTNVSMRFTTSGGLFRAAYYGALVAEQLTIIITHPKLEALVITKRCCLCK
jgi:hypothetical protein